MIPMLQLSAAVVMTLVLGSHTVAQGGGTARSRAFAAGASAGLSTFTAFDHSVAPTLTATVQRTFGRVAGEVSAMYVLGSPNQRCSIDGGGCLPLRNAIRYITLGPRILIPWEKSTLVAGPSVGIVDHDQKTQVSYGVALGVHLPMSGSRTVYIGSHVQFDDLSNELNDKDNNRTMSLLGGLLWSF